MRRRALIIGASGQLGQALSALLRQGGDEVLETAYQNPRPGQIILDLGNPQRATAIVRDLRPEWIVLAGAFCSVDRCETEQELCRRVNVEGPRAIATWAGDNEPILVYYSTDHLFDGSQGHSTESDAVHPLNTYARSKAEAEEALRQLMPGRHLILRTAWLYGPDRMRRNFALRLVDQISAGQPVRVPKDQWGCPTYTEDLAAATRFLLERGHTGTFHATGPDFVDRVSLARRICTVAGLDPQAVVPVPTEELGQPARRPLQVRLDCQKLAATGAPPLRGIEAGLRDLWQSQVSAKTP